MSFTASTAAEAGRVISTKEGRFVEVLVLNTAGSTRYLQVHDSATAPADTAVPKLVIAVTAGANGFISPKEAVKMENGCYVCLSSTAATKTLVLADEGFFGVEYDEFR